MYSSRKVSRRTFLQSASLTTAAIAAPALWIPRALATKMRPVLEQFDYGEVTLASELHEKQLHETKALLMGLSEDSLLKPFRQMSGRPAPGDDLGGWYNYDSGELRDDWVGFAPTATFGQWISALARMYAITGEPALREKVLRLNRLYAETISSDYYAKNRFPAYCCDKLVLGLIDSHRFVNDPDAFAILERTTTAALPQLPGHAIEHGKPWRPDHKTEDWNWDESYTLAENLFLAYQYGAGEKYRDLGKQYLYEQYYDRLARGENDMAGRHAYSHVNSLSSAMQAYLTLGSEKHLRAAKNAFDMLAAQSFATGGWGPDEQLRATGSDDLFASLTRTHHSFETPCGSYAHFKLTRYLLQVTQDTRYGDSMERVMYNTVLGARPLEPDGHTFYYSDYNFKGKKFYHGGRWPCCSGTLPQVAADYRLNAYFRDGDSVFVNLYVPSTVRWTHGNTQVSLTQTSRYPFESNVQFEVTASKPEEFAVNLRIPAWAEGASVAVNGKRIAEPVIPHTFASIRRQWKTGDRIEMDLPLRLRLEAINEHHPQTLALMSGPLVLFAMSDAPPAITSKELLAAKRIGPQKWRAANASGSLEFLPFTTIADEPYTTYLTVLA
jgi:DUF1680 family protein